MKQQTKITARELVLRPSYAEEFDNFREKLYTKEMQDCSGIDEYDARSIGHTNEAALKRGR